MFINIFLSSRWIPETNFPEKLQNMLIFRDRELILGTRISTKYIFYRTKPCFTQNGP